MASPLSLVAIFSLLSLGIFSGFLGGLLGIGGGIIIVPALVMLFGQDPHKAVGISAAVIIPTAFVAVIKHNSVDLIDFRLVLFIALAAVVGSYFGAVMNHSISGQMLKKVFAVTMILIGINMLFSQPTKPAAEQLAKQTNDL